MLANYASRHGDLFVDLGIPFDFDTAITLAQHRGVPDQDLFGVLRGWEATLTPRPWRLIYGDVHQGNVISTPDGLVLIDWELALAGADPLYEIAVHLTRMRYPPAKAEQIARAWVDAVPPEDSRNAEVDLPAYLRYERIKSTLVGSVRLADAVLAGMPVDQAAAELTPILAIAASIWQSTPLDSERVADVLDRWAERMRSART